MKLWHKLLILLGFGLVVGFVYLGSQQVVIRYIGLSNVSVALPFEEHIPFLPLLSIVYALVHLLPVWLILKLKRPGRILKTCLSFLMALAVHLAFFLLLPMEFKLRPEIQIPSTFLHEIMVFLYSVDRPINTFPSMHCSFAFLSYFLVRRYRPQWKTFFLILATAIVFSTFFVKQHYILDAVSGVLLAAGINFFFVCRAFPRAPNLS